MAIELYTKVDYDGTDIGPIYLDVERRTGLGGGVPVGHHGQDKYIRKGQTRRLLNTTQVQLSVDDGLLKHFSTNGAEERFGGDAPLTLTQTSGAVVEVLNP